MHFATLTSALLATASLVAADFHFGYVNYAVTTATGRYAVILPASQTTCLAAYDFYPKGPYGFNNVTESITTQICGRQIVLDPTSGSWYTNGRVIEQGTCDKINGGAGTRTDNCQTAPFESSAFYQDVLSCTSDICSGTDQEGECCDGPAPAAPASSKRRDAKFRS